MDIYSKQSAEQLKLPWGLWQHQNIIYCGLNHRFRLAPQNDMEIRKTLEPKEHFLYIYRIKSIAK